VATKKQRRRRQKGRRHEYEYVYVDEEGNEVEVDEDEEPHDRAESRAAKADGRKGGARPVRAGGREIQPASWRRVGKRGLIFAPLMFLVVTLLAPDDATLVQNVAQTLFLLTVSLPFSYLMDVMTYRMWRRRAEGGAARR
jgi:hypothetical protein